MKRGCDVKRAERLNPDSVAGGLLAVTVAITLAVVTMATASAFGVVVAGYLAVAVLRPVLDPLLSGWLVSRSTRPSAPPRCRRRTCAIAPARSRAVR